jgi:hypothetical protein
LVAVVVGCGRNRACAGRSIVLHLLELPLHARYFAERNHLICVVQRYTLVGEPWLDSRGFHEFEYEFA